MSKNFIILIGGPVLYHEDDPSHDKTWVNYVALMQKAARQGLYKLEGNEIVHWVVFEPPYASRWEEDSEYTWDEKVEAFFSDVELHKTRVKHAEAVKSKGARSYVHRIKQVATGLKIKYHGIQDLGGFWKYLATMPNGSINRVWYSGHASTGGLFVAAAHREYGGCSGERTPAVVATNLIPVSDITKHSHLAVKFNASTSKLSRFYGCNTAPFAEQWRNIFRVPAAGAKSKVNFKAITGRDVLKTIETMATAAGTPRWTEYR